MSRRWLQVVVEAILFSVLFALIVGLVLILFFATRPQWLSSLR